LIQGQQFEGYDVLKQFDRTPAEHHQKQQQMMMMISASAERERNNNNNNNNNNNQQVHVMMMNRRLQLPLGIQNQLSKIEYEPKSSVIGGMLQCKLLRQKGGFFDGNTYFTLRSEVGDHMLLGARKRAAKSVTNFVISLDDKDTSVQSENFAGKIKGNVAKTMYTVYSRGEKPLFDGDYDAKTKQQQQQQQQQSNTDQEFDNIKRAVDSMLFEKNSKFKELRKSFYSKEKDERQKQRSLIEEHQEFVVGVALDVWYQSNVENNNNNNDPPVKTLRYHLKVLSDANITKNRRDYIAKGLRSTLKNQRQQKTVVAAALNELHKKIEDVVETQIKAMKQILPPNTFELLQKGAKNYLVQQQSSAVSAQEREKKALAEKNNNSASDYVPPEHPLGSVLHDWISEYRNKESKDQQNSLLSLFIDFPASGSAAVSNSTIKILSSNNSFIKALLDAAPLKFYEFAKNRFDAMINKNNDKSLSTALAALGIVIASSEEHVKTLNTRHVPCELFIDEVGMLDRIHDPRSAVESKEVLRLSSLLDGFLSNTYVHIITGPSGTGKTVTAFLVTRPADNGPKSITIYLKGGDIDDLFQKVKDNDARDEHYVKEVVKAVKSKSLVGDESATFDKDDSCRVCIVIDELGGKTSLIRALCSCRGTLRGKISELLNVNSENCVDDRCWNWRRELRTSHSGLGEWLILLVFDTLHTQRHQPANRVQLLVREPREEL
jgi:hypothetical protein